MIENRVEIVKVDNETGFLQEVGLAGWELVAAYPLPAAGMSKLYLKRVHRLANKVPLPQTNRCGTTGPCHDGPCSCYPRG